MNVAVFFGGESCEHDISIITGEQLIDNIDKNSYSIIPIYIDKFGNWLTGEELLDLDNFNSNFKKLYKCALLPNDNNLYINKGKKYKTKCKIDVAILCVHGNKCEDGSLSGILEMCKIPYSSASICASSVCLDKCVFKYFCKGVGASCIDGIDISDREYYLNREGVIKKIKELGFPIIIKPCRLGSSIGIEIVENIENLDVQISKSFSYDSRVLIEKYVDIKKEVNIALLDYMGDIVFSETEEPVGSNKFLSFDDKYVNSGGFHSIKRIMPANITENDKKTIKNMAEILYKKLGLSGVVRCDFIIDNNDVIYINEINTIPGSMAYYLFDSKEINYSTLIEKLIENAIYRKNYEDNFKKIYTTEVLKSGILGLKK